MLTELFKLELKNYQNYLHYRENLLGIIDAVEYDLTGVKGIRYDKIPTSQNPSLSEERKLYLIEKLEDLRKELKRVDLNIEHTEKLMESLNDEELEMVTLVLVEHETLRRVASRLYISHPALSKRIRKILEKLEKETC